MSVPPLRFVIKPWLHFVVPSLANVVFAGTKALDSEVEHPEGPCGPASWPADLANAGSAAGMALVSTRLTREAFGCGPLVAADRDFRAELPYTARGSAGCHWSMPPVEAITTTPLSVMEKPRDRSSSTS